jgi:putative DNA primase/helicase
MIACNHSRPSTEERNEREDNRMATASYRHEQDILGDFIEDLCILERSATITKASLRQQYKGWCLDNNIDPVEPRTFRARLMERGINEGRSSDHKTRIWEGIRLINDMDKLLNDMKKADKPDKPDKTKIVLKLNGQNGQQIHQNPYTRENKKKFTENAVRDVRDVRNQMSADAGNVATMPERPTKCAVCGSTDFWLAPSGVWLCARCHPMPKDKG